MLTLNQKKILDNKKTVISRNIESLCLAIAMEHAKEDSENKVNTLKTLGDLLDNLIEYEDLLSCLMPFLEVAQKMNLQVGDELSFHEASENTEISVEMNQENHRRAMQDMTKYLGPEQASKVLSEPKPGQRRTETLFGLDTLRIKDWILLLENLGLAPESSSESNLESNLEPTPELKDNQS